MNRMLYGAVLALAVSACAAPEVITSCDPMENAYPLCGWQNPEDMAAMPDDRFILVSEYGGMSGGPGMLSGLDRQTGPRQVLPDGRGPKGTERRGGENLRGH